MPNSRVRIRCTGSSLYPIRLSQHRRKWQRQGDTRGIRTKPADPEAPKGQGGAAREEPIFGTASGFKARGRGVARALGWRPAESMADVLGARLSCCQHVETPQRSNKRGELMSTREKALRTPNPPGRTLVIAMVSSIVLAANASAQPSTSARPWAWIPAVRF